MAHMDKRQVSIIVNNGCNIATLDTQPVIDNIAASDKGSISISIFI
jgi:hypothetical protein